MNRRRFLATAAILGTAGCISSGNEDTQTTRPSDTTSRTPTTSVPTSTEETAATTTAEQITVMEPNGDGKGQLGEMRYSLEERGIDVQSFQIVDNDIVIEYPHVKLRDDYVDNVSVVTFEYAAHVEYDGRGQQVTARTVDDFGDLETEYYIERDWVETYNEDDDVSDRDLIVKVAEENNISLVG